MITKTPQAPLKKRSKCRGTNMWEKSATSISPVLSPTYLVHCGVLWFAAIAKSLDVLESLYIFFGTPYDAEEEICIVLNLSWLLTS